MSTNRCPTTAKLRPEWGLLLTACLFIGLPEVRQLLSFMDILGLVPFETNHDTHTHWLQQLEASLVYQSACKLRECASNFPAEPGTAEAGWPMFYGKQS